MVELHSSAKDEDEDEVEKSRMTLGEHLAELRVRLIRSSVAILVFFCVAWAFRVPLATFVERPYREASTNLNAQLEQMAADAIAKDPEAWKDWYEPGYLQGIEIMRFDKRIPETMKGEAASGFIVDMKMCFWFAIAFGGPVLLWEMWQFIAAGLYRRERRIVLRYFPLSLGLFVGGIVFGYLVMVPAALYFLALQTLSRIQWYQSIDYYWNMLVNLTLALGLVFQIPVVMLALARVGLVKWQTYAKYRGHHAVAALIVAAILTPPDPITQMLMGGPIIVLYEAGIWISRFATRGSKDEHVG